MAGQEARGKLKKLRGQGKEFVGILTGNSKLEREGDREQVAGDVQASLGKARRKLGKLVETASDRIKK